MQSTLLTTANRTTIVPWEFCLTTIRGIGAGPTGFQLMVISLIGQHDWGLQIYAVENGSSRINW